jgi:hypothetical protein
MYRLAALSDVRMILGSSNTRVHLSFAALDTIWDMDICSLVRVLSIDYRDHVMEPSAESHQMSEYDL